MLIVSPSAARYIRNEIRKEDAQPNTNIDKRDVRIEQRYVKTASTLK